MYANIIIVIIYYREIPLLIYFIIIHAHKYTCVFMIYCWIFVHATLRVLNYNIKLVCTRVFSMQN